MPTRKPIKPSQFRWTVLIGALARWRPDHPHGIIGFLRNEIRYGGRSFLERLETLFDPDLSDLQDLPIGYFDTKILFIPSSRLPESEADLLKHCRSLIDHKQDDLHLKLMLKNLPGGFSLEEHVHSLWQLRKAHFELFCDVTRGIHGRAISAFKRERTRGPSADEFKAILARHALVLCALDAQIAIVGGRVAAAAPFGRFMDGNTRPKGGTALRLMRDLFDAGEKTEADFQAGDNCDVGARAERKSGSKQSKVIGHVLGGAEKPWTGFLRRISRSTKSNRYIVNGALEEVGLDPRRAKNVIDEATGYNLANGTGPPKKDNAFRSFHAIWYSDLTATTGAAVSLLRFAMVEKQIQAMVEEAFGANANPQPCRLQPLAPPPSGLDRQSPLVVRTLDLLDSARRVQLDDERYRSRTAKSQRDLGVRDPEDMAGLRPIMEAIDFLKFIGPRFYPFDHLSGLERDRQETYFHLDVVPERRLNLIDEPDLSFLG